MATVTSRFAAWWRERRRNRVAALGSAAFVSALVITWLAVAVVVPVLEQAACAGVEFRAPVAEAPTATSSAVPVPPAPDTVPSTLEPVDRPPIGGEGGVAGRVRKALRGDAAAVYCDDFADPYVLRVGDTYYAYSTNTEDTDVPVLTSSGLFGTGRRSEALDRLAAWSAPGSVWAPTVLERPGGYVLYYSTRAPGEERQCLSVAAGPEPDAFSDASGGPLVCPDGGGAIDASPYVAPDGRPYLLWKHYGPELHGIVAQELTPDGLGLVGPRELVLRDDQPWENGLVEAPSMVTHEGRIYLFYSANDWATANYAVGYAVCDTPLGPCTKATGPWLGSIGRAAGPGGQEVFTDEEGRPWLALHAWLGDQVGYPSGARNLFVLRLEFVDGVPRAS